MPWEEILLRGWSSTWCVLYGAATSECLAATAALCLCHHLPDYVVIGLLIGMMLLAAAQSLARGKFEL
jgi:hypothetical protein